MPISRVFPRGEMQQPVIDIGGNGYTMHLGLIESTSLGTNDHGVFDLWLNLDYGDSSGQGFGGYVLDEPVFDGIMSLGHPNDKTGEFKGRVGTAAGMEYIMTVMKVVGVSTWEEVKGKMIYALKKRQKGEWSTVVGIAAVNSPESNYLLAEEFFRDFEADRSRVRNHKELG